MKNRYNTIMNYYPTMHNWEKYLGRSKRKVYRSAAERIAAKKQKSTTQHPKEPNQKYHK